MLHTSFYRSSTSVAGPGVGRSRVSMLDGRGALGSEPGSEVCRLFSTQPREQGTVDLLFLGEMDSEQGLEDAERHRDLPARARGQRPIDPIQLFGEGGDRAMVDRHGGGRPAHRAQQPVDRRIQDLVFHLGVR